ncbi:hypothetical protein GJ496_005912 [Pomphorhynchus laevis]|nr:hypothetical protein GJ496_005912 [Pomphorhynchus laevis]
MKKKSRTHKSHTKLKAVDPFYNGPRKAQLHSHLYSSDRPPTYNDDCNDQKRKLISDKIRKQKRRWHPDTNGSTVPVKESSAAHQLSGESRHEFIKRINNNAYVELRKVQLLGKNMENDNFKIKNNEQPWDIIKSSESKSKDNLQRNVDLSNRANRKRRKRNRNKRRSSPFEKERIPFGQVVHAPPVFSVKPRGVKRKMLLSNALQKCTNV